MSLPKNVCPPVDPLLGVDAKNVTSLVDSGVEIEGVIRVKNNQAILVSGVVIGSIDSNGPVILNEGGEVRGSIKASALQVAGKIVRNGDSGEVLIDGPLVLQESGFLGCDAESTGVQMAYGASIDGAIRPRKNANGEIIKPARPVAAAVPASAPVSPVRADAGERPIQSPGPAAVVRPMPISSAGSPPSFLADQVAAEQGAAGLR